MSWSIFLRRASLLTGDISVFQCSDAGSVGFVLRRFFYPRLAKIAGSYLGTVEGKGAAAAMGGLLRSSGCPSPPSWAYFAVPNAGIFLEVSLIGNPDLVPVLGTIL